MQGESDEDRRIFAYRLGGAERRADPLAMLRRIRQAQRDLGFGLNEAQKVIGRVEEARDLGVDLPVEMVDGYYEALGQVAAISRSAFGAADAESDPLGWTEGEALAALSDFFEWMRGTREDFTSTPSPATSTGPGSSQDPPAAASPTAPSSGSGSTATGS